MRDPAADLAATLRQLRDLRGWTQRRLAEVAGVPRPTIASLESGAGNPTLSVLVRLARAFDVTLDELVSPPRVEARVIPADRVPVSRRGSVEVRALVPDALPGAVVERLFFPVGAAMTGVPHTAGTREILTCERGRIAVTAGGERFEVGPGDVLVFRGDQKHGYANAAGEPSVAYSVVLPR